jgi:hypothetical protein
VSNYLRQDKQTGRSFFEHPGDSKHAACNVEMTIAAKAWGYLKSRGREPANENLDGFEHLMLSLIVVCHEEMGRPVFKKELRECFPGIGGDLLTVVLDGQAQKRRVRTGQGPVMSFHCERHAKFQPICDGCQRAKRDYWDPKSGAGLPHSGSTQVGVASSDSPKALSSSSVVSRTRPLTYPSTLLLTAIDYYYQPRPSGNDYATATTLFLRILGGGVAISSSFTNSPCLFLYICERGRLCSD